MFICPITKMELNGNQPFVAIWTTGFVLSEKAVREIGIENLQADYGPFSSEDLIKLLPCENELVSQTSNMLSRRSKKKKSLKIQKNSENGNSKSFNEKKINGIDNKIDQHQENKKRKANNNDNNNITDQTNNSNDKTLTTTQHTFNNNTKLVKDAENVIKNQESRSEIYKNLFHSDHEKDENNRDLFICVSSLRYTLH
jgi:hypothetical protein